MSIEINAETIDTAHEKRDQHLRSPDFFSTNQFPTIEFKSTAVEKTSDGYAVTGDLKLRGKTKSITVDMVQIGAGEDPWGNYRVGFDGSFTIKRSEFGVSYMPKGLGEEVEIMISVEGIKKK